MHVGMEETVTQRVAQEGLDHRTAEILQVEPWLSSRARFRQRGCIESFEREHARRCGSSRPRARENRVRLVSRPFPKERGLQP